MYPYSFAPDVNSPSKKLYGLVSENNEKIIEPTFDLIQPILNQPKNAYTIYLKKIPNDSGNPRPVKYTKGVIDNTGKVIKGVENEYLEYDGIGNIAHAQENGNLKIFNINSGKWFQAISPAMW